MLGRLGDFIEDWLDIAQAQRSVRQAERLERRWERVSAALSTTVGWGENVEEAVSSKEALVLSGLDWQVLQEPIRINKYNIVEKTKLQLTVICKK